MILLLNKALSMKAKTISAHSVARLGEGSHFVATLYTRMLRAVHTASGYPHSHCTTPAVHGHVTILMMALLTSLRFLTKSG